MMYNMLGGVGGCWERGEETGCWLMRVSQTPNKYKGIPTNLRLIKYSCDKEVSICCLLWYFNLEPWH